MVIDDTQFELRLAQTAEDLRLAQSLRYDVFVRELGSDGDMVDHADGLEIDRFDPFFDHLMLMDRSREDNPCVGVYRLMREDQAAEAGQFYCDDEYDLTVLKAGPLKLLELGRSCVHADYRGGTAMLHLWNGLAEYVENHGIDLIFGVASFHGTDASAFAAPLSLLHHRYLAPQEIRVRARDEGFQRMDLIDEAELDRVAAARAMPSLIKGYLKMGGFVGEGAFIDRPFNTTDICLLLDVKRVSQKQFGLYAKGARR
ncbi:GNAT family N-acetyltransferase [Nioella aestuarii]|uniref:GNAT family N-acetyltransferase n=1 Tax=Nioella aestuarii TaxID=1662864 RepID=UPI003D7F878D